MTKFVIESHFRLQEWVAEEKGYFRDEGLDYEFRELIRSTEGQHHNKVNEGAFQSIEKGRKADVSCACHWTVNVAASNGHAKLYADAKKANRGQEPDADTWTGTEAEKKCLAFQRQVLLELKADPSTITYLDECEKNPTYQGHNRGWKSWLDYLQRWW